MASWPALVCFLHNALAAKDPCPPGTVNYNNESCYLFIDTDDLIYLNEEVLKVPKRTPTGIVRRWGMRGDYVTYGLDSYDEVIESGDSIIHASRGGRGAGESLMPCVWNRRQAQNICARVHEMAKYARLALYAKSWHLPVLDLPSEDDWFNEQLTKRKGEMGTHVWIDLIKAYDERIWVTTGQEPRWFHRPMGVDPWWKRANVLMKKREEHEVMCYEYHVDYEWPREGKYAEHRYPYPQPMLVRGWHPRACYMAYEQEAQLDNVEDFTGSEIVNAASRYAVTPVRLMANAIPDNKGRSFLLSFFCNR